MRGATKYNITKKDTFQKKKELEQISQRTSDEVVDIHLEAYHKF